MSGRSNEIEAAVDSVVGHLPPVDPRLCIEEVFKLAVNVFRHRLPAEERKSSHDTQQDSGQKKKL